MKRVVGVLVVAGVVGWWCASSALADTVTVNWQGVSPGSTSIQVHDPATNTNGTFYTGVNNFTKVSGSALIPNSFDAFCIEFEDLKPSNVGGSHTYDIVALESAPNPGVNTDGTGDGPMSQDKADNLRKLWKAYFKSNFTNDEGAAFQLAVWEIVYDSDSSLTKPTDTNVAQNSFYVVSGGGAAQTKAQTWLDNLSTLTEKANLVALSAVGDQDFITVVPLPAAGLSTIALLGLLAGARFYRGRRRAA